MASFSKTLRNFFGIDTQKGQKSDKDITPVKPRGNEKEIPKRVKFSSDVQKLWDSYISENTDSFKTLQFREERFKDLEYMVYNDTIVSSAVDLYADEVSQVDNQMNIIEATAPDKEVSKEIQHLLNLWGIDQNYIRECAWNIVLYGESVDIVDYSPEKGIENLIPVDVRDMTERMEFKTSEMLKKLGTSNPFITTKRVQDIVQALEDNKQNITHNFKSYLIGFKIGNQYLPPWAVNHYRLHANRSEFFPYGRSLFIHLISPYRQLKTSKNLMALTRALKFPKEIYSVQTNEGMTEIEQFEVVNQTRQEFENNGRLNRSKEEFSVGGEIWVPEGLISHKTIENNLSVDDINDIEMLREDLIMGTKIPKGYLIISDRGTFGTSGQSLLQQSKPFGRSVYSIQSVILSNLSHLIRLHFLMTNKFQKEFTEFQLSMDFPVLEEASDRLRMKQDTLRLAKDILDNLKDTLGLDRDQKLPADVITSVFSKFSFLSDEEVEEYVKLIVDSMETEDEDEGNSGFYGSADIRDKLDKRMNESVIQGSYFRSINNLNFKEKTFNKKHFLVSSENFINEDYKEIYADFRKEFSRETKLED